MRPRDDSKLMQDLAAGDRQALQELYERHAERVFRTAFRFLHDKDEARDITQSVFVTIMQSAGRYRPEARLTTWIYRIVVNRCLDHRAGADRRMRTVLTDREIEQIPASEADRPDRIAQRAEQRAQLLAAIRELPKRQRLALILRRFEEQSYDEIAVALGCSRKSLESLLVRAREALARHFSK